VHSRRDFLRFGAAAGVTAIVPRVARFGRRARQVDPLFLLTGGATADGILVNSTLSGRDAHAFLDLAVSRYPHMADRLLVGKRQADADSIVRHVVTGQQPDTTYYARLVSDGVLVGQPVRYKTLPSGQQSWTRKIAVVSCQSNDANTMATELAWSDILAWGADDIWHLGDWGYWGQMIAPDAPYTDDLHHYTSAMGNFPTMRRAIQSGGLNVVCISDHELTIGGDPDGGMHNSPESIRELVAFQALMPVRRYGDTRVPRRGRYYTFDIGTQVRVIVTDFRSPDRSNADDEDGPKKTMFGATQLAWLLGSLDTTKVNIVTNETSWLADADRNDGRATDKPWHYYHEQQIIADYVTGGGYNVAWVGGDRHYVGYLAGQGNPHNSLGGFPCYISSGLSKYSLDLQPGELMTWQFGAGNTSPKRPVCGYMRLNLSYSSVSGEVALNGQGRAVMDTTQRLQDWRIQDIPGGTAHDAWPL
jgi:PhoD-like phosphatase